MKLKLWAALIVLVVGLVVAMQWMAETQRAGKPQRVDLMTDKMKRVTGAQEKKPKPQINATKQPGRVVVLNTNRGAIEFVLYEKDCPKTTARIAELVSGGFYDGVRFPRVEDWVIQTEPTKKDMPPMGIEIVDGLTHAKGTVGMARTDDPNSNTSIFYITLEPAFHLDMEYTNFGRVIKGMDVAMNIQTGDLIKSAKLRALTDNDKKLFNEALKAESDRRTQ